MYTKNIILTYHGAENNKIIIIVNNLHISCIIFQKYKLSIHLNDSLAVNILCILLPVPWFSCQLNGSSKFCIVEKIVNFLFNSSRKKVSYFLKYADIFQIVNTMKIHNK